MNRIYIFLVLILLSNTIIRAQDSEWTVQLEPIIIEGLPGAQSYAFGRIEGYWIIIGGRLDGLHQRQPFASFDPIHNNKEIILIEASSNKSWSVSLNSLPSRMKEQLQSANMQFHQKGEYLYLTGGYGYSEIDDEHITYPYLTRVDLKELKEAILSDMDIRPAFVQKECNDCAVAGGRLEMIEDQYYLVGGHYFHGRYNPHGPDHGPGFTQVYTGEVRIFNIENSVNDFNFDFEESIKNEMHLGKRDYNLIPQIRDGEEMLVAFSGVFQKHIDLPYLYPVEIFQNNVLAIESFSQYLNHYHCATIPIYDLENEKMNNLFFGGIAQFYFEDDVMVQDNNVPFVKSISNVSYTEEEGWKESLLAIEMPDYFGAGSEFILADNVPVYNNGVIKLNELDQEQTIGYIYGGIKSSAPNIFWINNGSQSEATPTIFKVSIKKSHSVSSTEVGLDEPYFIIVPNPNRGYFRIIYNSASAADEIQISIQDLKGNRLGNMEFQNVTKGKNYFEVGIPNLKNGLYLVQLESEGKKIVRKVVVEN